MVFEFLLPYQKTPHIFLSLSSRLTTNLALVGFWPYLSNQMFCYAVLSFLNLVISWRVHSLYLGSYNKGILKVIINLWKENGMNFDCPVIISLLLFCFLYGLLPTHQVVSTLSFSIYLRRTCTYFISLSHSRLLAMRYTRFEFINN